MAMTVALMVAAIAVQATLIFTRQHRLPRFSEVSSSSFVALFFVLITVAIYFVIEARAGKRAAELRATEAENKQLRAQVATLTAQMNPHLLFNTLNTIAALSVEQSQSR